MKVIAMQVICDYDMSSVNKTTTLQFASHPDPPIN